MGQCPACQEWGTLVEERVADKPAKGDRSLGWTARSQPRKIAQIEAGAEIRLATPDDEFNRVLGGEGVVRGAVTLLAGEPGIGKSTLLLQLALRLSGRRVLYVSGEESESQIKLRASRLSFFNDELYVAAETSLERIVEFFRQLEPDLLIVDSIQTVFSDVLDSAPGSVTQVRECAARLLRLAKETHTPVFLVGHITKEGQIAGPRVLEHMVDTVLSFEGDQHNSYRMVRTTKNRFGSTLEIGIYEMTALGLREVSNPSEIFLSNAAGQFSGVAIAATLEGNRPLLIETQALVSAMTYGTAQRSATGFDLRRLSMLLAVLEKRCGFKLGVQDIFVNLAGGLRLDDPAIDLALVCAIISSLHDLPIDPKTVFAAEIGLSGEIRAVSRIEPRLAEAAKLGFTRIFVAGSQLQGATRNFPGLRVIGVEKLDAVFREVFG
ncbi:MAG: DNA repair protein RadA [Bacteroidia bacterium]